MTSVLQLPITPPRRDGFILMALWSVLALGVPGIGLAQGEIPLLACKCTRQEKGGGGSGAYQTCHGGIFTLDLNEIKKSEFTIDFKSEPTRYSWKIGYPDMSIIDHYISYVVDRSTLQYYENSVAPEFWVRTVSQCEITKPKI